MGLSLCWKDRTPSAFLRQVYNCPGFVGALAHEVGHAENAKGNTQIYVAYPGAPLFQSDPGHLENALSVGAQVAMDFLSEGKSMYNNIVVTQEIYQYSNGHYDVPVSGSATGIEEEIFDSTLSDASAIMAGAGSYWNAVASLNENAPHFIQNYWNAVISKFSENLPPNLANKNVLNELINLKMAKADGLSFAQNADGTIAMTISFANGPVASYTDTFGNYGAVVPDNQSGGQVPVVPLPVVSASPTNVMTEQVFDFANGESLTDAYNTTGSINPNHTSTNYSEAIYKTTEGDGSGNLIFGQFDQTDSNGNVTSADIVGQGDIATLSNVGNIELESGAKADVIGAGNSITLDGHNALGLSVGSSAGGFINDAISNLQSGDTLDFLGITDASASIISALNGNYYLSVTGTGGYAYIPLTGSGYSQYFAFAKSDGKTGTDVSIHQGVTINVSGEAYTLVGYNDAGPVQISFTFDNSDADMTTSSVTQPNGLTITSYTIPKAASSVTLNGVMSSGYGASIVTEDAYGAEYHVSISAGSATLNMSFPQQVYTNPNDYYLNTPPSGDIVNLPEITASNLAAILTNPAVETYLAIAPVAERLTESGGSAFQTYQLELTSVSQETACYCRGTRIRAVRGDVEIETLSEGDSLVTASGDNRAVKWVGHRKVDCLRHPKPSDVWPIQVVAGAFGEGMPARDLWLSPGHNIAVEGVLAPIKALQNGITVVQREWSAVEYWHVELEQHDIILAEGLAAESYLDTGNRTAFANGGAFIEAHPDFGPKNWRETCIPLVQNGPEIVRAKTLLLERIGYFGYAVTSKSDIHLMVDGKRIQPIELSASRFAFTLSANCADIRLMSRTFIPAHVHAASVDERSLGLCVARLQIDGEDVCLGEVTCVSTGWHEMEAGFRWTSGSTTLPPCSRLILIDLAGPGHYWQPKRDNVVPLYATQL